MSGHEGLDRRGFLKALGALAGVGVAAATIGPATAAGMGAAGGMVRRTQSGEPRVLLHDGAVMQNVTVENAPIDVRTAGPVTISDSTFHMTASSPDSAAIKVNPAFGQPGAS